MKKRILLPLVLFLACATGHSQLSITTSTTSRCIGTGSISAWVTSSPTNAATYSWSAVSQTCSGSIGLLAGNGSSVTIGFPCCGTFTLTCSAYDSGSSLITTAVTTVTIYCQPTVGGSVSNPTVCSANTVTFSGSGASTYSWIAANANNPTNGVGYFASVSQNYTVIGMSAQGCTNAAFVSHSVIPTPTQAPLASSWQVCLGSSATLTANGAQNYTWVPVGNFAGSNMASVAVMPTVTTTYTLMQANSSCVNMHTITVIVNLPPTIFIVGSPSSGTMCLGSTATLTAGGAVAYTWTPFLFGNPVVISPSVSTCYSLAGTNGTCIGYASYCMSVIPQTTTLTVTGNTVVCAGSSTTLTASGASSYQWQPGNFSGNPFVVTPSVSTMYTVYDVGGSQCPGQESIVVIVNPTPTIQASAQPQSISCGNSATMTCATNAAQPTYTWSSGANTASAVVTPLQSTCYTVIVTNGMTGCSGLSSVCLTVNPAPLSFAGTPSVCMGSSADLTVTPVGTYTWLPGNLTGTVVNVLPSSPTVYTVSGTMSGGCAGMGTFALSTNTACAIVWPGDANSDGVANLNDVLEIGLQFSSTGPARTPTSSTWSGQYATAWTGTVSTGKNKAHGDCNGDGTINHADTMVVANNFTMTHSFKLSQSQGNDIILVTQGTVAGPGWNKAEIRLGSAADPITSLYGIAFELGFDPAIIAADAYITYLPSFLNAGNAHIHFRKPDYANGKVHTASVRTDQANVSGNGTIGEFWFRVKDGVADGTPVNLTLSGTRKVSATGTIDQLSATGAALSFSSNPVGLLKRDASAVRIFPNPSSGTLFIDGSVHLSAAVYDLTGRLLLKAEEVKQLDISALSAGSYILILEGEGISVQKRVVKE
jgi:hypothetical protein